MVKLDLVKEGSIPGETMNIRNSGNVTIKLKNGEKIQGYIFALTLPYSGYSYIKVRESRDIEDWVKAHEDAFYYICGCPTIINSYEHQIEYKGANILNYWSLQEHYKIKINSSSEHICFPYELEKLIAYIKKILRNHKFRDIDDFRYYIREMCGVYNSQNLHPKTNQSLIEECISTEVQSLQPLPKKRYKYRELLQRRVSGSKISLMGKKYAVPKGYNRHQLLVEVTKEELKLHCEGKLIATIKRSEANHG